MVTMPFKILTARGEMHAEVKEYIKALSKYFMLNIHDWSDPSKYK